MRILHVFSDDKFFDRIAINFDLLEDVDNLYIFYSPNKEYKFEYIKSHHKIQIENNKENYLKLFSDSQIDVVFFHALRSSYYEYILKTDIKKILIWWSWGFDLYNTGLIKIELYKPLTLQTKKSRVIKLSKTSLSYIRKLKSYLLTLRSDFVRRSVIKRIDYCVTVLPIEFELLSNVKFFSAKRFMERAIFSAFEPLELSKTPPILGNVLVGNSATWENNHLDLIEILNQTDLGNGRKFILPLNYGDHVYAKIIKANLNDNFLSLDDFLDYNQYLEMLQSCSHVIFGCMRQQALGNIFLCFRKGIKIFLYKKSLNYIQLKKDGYIVFSIEDDLTSDSLSIPLTIEQVKHNQQVLKKIHSMNGLDSLKSNLMKIQYLINP